MMLVLLSTPPVCRLSMAGVSLFKQGQKRKPWQACISVKGKNKHVGYYESQPEAAYAYDKAARELYEDNERLNFPHENHDDVEVSTGKKDKTSRYRGM